MKVLDIILAVFLPPVAVAVKPGGASGAQVILTFLLWLCGWFPGVIYAVWLITADFRRIEEGAGPARADDLRAA
ncbi:MAG TPA: YqaE/Pmp3 family membrane protein [Mycobacterium sp.]|nr:YqaE/Pmp3 family membrane protein [Mycobacterium sp.]